MVNHETTENLTADIDKTVTKQHFESSTQNQPRPTIDQYGYKNYSLKYPFTLCPPSRIHAPPPPHSDLHLNSEWCTVVWLIQLELIENSEQPTCHANCTCLPQCMVLHGILRLFNGGRTLDRGFTGVARQSITNTHSRICGWFWFIRCKVPPWRLGAPFWRGVGGNLFISKWIGITFVSLNACTYVTQIKKPS